MNSTIRQLALAGASSVATLGLLAAAPAPAQAAPACGGVPVAWNTVFTAGFACQVGNAIADSFIAAFALPANTTGSVSFAFLPGDVVDLDFSFNPGTAFTAGQAVGYRLTLLDPNEVFNGVASDVNGNNVPTRPGVTQQSAYVGLTEVYTADPDLDVSALLLASLESINGARDPLDGYSPVSPASNSIYTITAFATRPQLPSGADATINNVSQQYTTATQSVPGPLGVAGVGAMLATARRLRRRIKAVA
jgi:hypothetical protein